MEQGIQQAVQHSKHFLRLGDHRIRMLLIEIAKILGNQDLRL